MARGPTRRRLISGGVAVAATGAVCAGLARLPAPGEGRRVLSDREAEVVGRLGDAIWPAHNAIGVSGREAHLVDGVDALLADTLGDDQVLAFRQVVRAFDLAVDVDGLAPAELLAQLQIWQAPDELFTRVAADGLKAVLGLAYFNDDAVLDAVGFDSRCHR